MVDNFTPWSCSGALLELMTGKLGVAAGRRGRFARDRPTPLRSYSDQMLCSPGVQRVRDELRGKWLINLVAAYQLGPAIQGIERQFWHLKRPASRNRYENARLTCRDGSGKIVWSETILTDFPAPGVKLFVSGGSIMLLEEAPEVRRFANSMGTIVRRPIGRIGQRLRFL